MTWLIGLLTGGIPDLIKGFFGWLGQKTNATLEMFRTGNTNAAQVSTAVVAGDVQKSLAQFDFNKSAMNHPIWWIGWALYVLPAGVHNLAVHFVSTFHLALIVDKLPPDFIAQDKLIVMSLFGAQVGTGVIDRVTAAWVARRV